MGNLRFRMRKLVDSRVADSVSSRVSWHMWIEFSPRITFQTLVETIRSGMHKTMYW